VKSVKRQTPHNQYSQKYCSDLDQIWTFAIIPCCLYYCMNDELRNYESKSRYPELVKKGPSSTIQCPLTAFHIHNNFQYSNISVRLHATSRNSQPKKQNNNNNNNLVQSQNDDRRFRACVVIPYHFGSGF